MGKRYKEFIIDILTKSYQILLGVAIVAPVVTGKLNYYIYIPSLVISIMLLFWAGAIASQMEV